jgi:hypothetical protein
MASASDKKKPGALVLIIFSILQAIRLVLRLFTGPPELGKAGNGESLGFWIDMVMVAALTISIFNLDAIFKVHEQNRQPTIIVLVVGLASTIALLVLGD